MADLIERLRAFEGSDELGNGDFSLLSEAAATLEALRAEVERVTCELMDAITRGDKLAEALQLAEEHIGALTPEWYSAGQRVLTAIRAALEQENNND